VTTIKHSRRTRYTVSCIFLCIYLLILSACQAKTENLNTAQSTKTVTAYIDAYNEHNIQKMMTFLDEEVYWMSVSGNKINVETSGKSGLEDILKDYFSKIPSTRSELQSVSTNGNFVNAVEKAFWEENGNVQTQCANSVYELKDGLILNIWYFDSQACE